MKGFCETLLVSKYGYELNQLLVDPKEVNLFLYILLEERVKTQGSAGKEDVGTFSVLNLSPQVRNLEISYLVLGFTSRSQ